MGFIFSIGMVIIGFVLTVWVNRRNTKEIEKLKNEMNEINQHYQMNLLYGKAVIQKEETKEEGFNEERSGDTTTKAAR